MWSPNTFEVLTQNPHSKNNYGWCIGVLHLWNFEIEDWKKKRNPKWVEKISNRLLGIPDTLSCKWNLLQIECLAVQLIPLTLIPNTHMPQYPDSISKRLSGRGITEDYSNTNMQTNWERITTIYHQNNFLCPWLLLGSTDATSISVLSTNNSKFASCFHPTNPNYAVGLYPGWCYRDEKI